MKPEYCSKDVYHLLAAIPRNSKSLLDLGCGRGIIGALVMIYRSMNMTVGIEHFPPYIKFCSEHGLYDKLLNLDLSLVNSLPFSDREFDVATCIEVLEHLPKQSGIKILKEIERVARKVVITTPRSPHAERWNLENYKFTLNPELFDNNPNMIHQSKWTLKEFKKQGYKVHGYGNFGLRKVGFVLQGCSWIIPRLAENYLCEKETSE